MRLRLGNGRGYVSGEVNERESDPIDSFTLTQSFASSPRLLRLLSLVVTSH